MAASCGGHCNSPRLGGTNDAGRSFSHLWRLRANVHKGGGEFWQISPRLHLSSNCLRPKLLGALQ